MTFSIIYMLRPHSQAWCRDYASENSLLYFTFHKSRTESWVSGTNERLVLNCN